VENGSKTLWWIAAGGDDHDDSLDPGLGLFESLRHGAP
jgi:hypothetical protein